MPATTTVTAFNNIPARSREQRLAIKDKELREKDRLQQRKEGFARIDTSVMGSAMLVYEPKSQGHMSDADRFHSDTAGEERAYREERMMRTRMQQERKRIDTVQREVTRWKDMDAASAQEEKKYELYRQQGSKARRNKGGEAFNPITLQYCDGKDGQRLAAADAAVKHRALVRATNLQHHNSRDGVNPITGDPIRRIEMQHLLPPPSSSR